MINNAQQETLSYNEDSYIKDINSFISKSTLKNGNNIVSITKIDENKHNL